MAKLGRRKLEPQEKRRRVKESSSLVQDILGLLYRFSEAIDLGDFSILAAEIGVSRATIFNWFYARNIPQPPYLELLQITKKKLERAYRE